MIHTSPYERHRYSAAVAKERFVRTVSYLPINETICGLDVLPLTLWHLTTLEAIGSPFICGGPVSPAAIGAFLWLVSPDYAPKSKWRRWRFLQRVGKLRVSQPYGPLPADFNPALHSLRMIANEIRAYLDEAEQDFPASSGKRGASYCSTATVLIDALAKEYNWQERDILRLPMKRLWQYMNRIAQRNGAMMFNPSDSVRGDWLNQLN